MIPPLHYIGVLAGDRCKFNCGVHTKHRSLKVFWLAFFYWHMTVDFFSQGGHGISQLYFISTNSHTMRHAIHVLAA